MLLDSGQRLQQLQDAQQQRDEERQAAGLREIAKISAAHRLNGHDRNVLQQWRDDGFAGRRPQLSFEIQALLQQEKEQELLEQLREAERAEQRRQRAAMEQAEWEAVQEEERQWRIANPELARQKDAEREQRLQEAAERYRRIQETFQQEAERKRGDRELYRRAAEQGALSLDTFEFLRWCEIATEEELAQFDRQCLKRARELRPMSLLERLWDWLNS